MKKLYLSKELLLGGAIIAAPLCSLVMTGVFQNDMPLFPLLIICLLTLFFRLLLFLKTGRKIKEVRLTACDIAVALFINLPAMATAKGRCCGAFNIQMVSVCSGLYFGANGES